jgi:RNA polymerase sigma-70 factor (ECF subfamily)
MFSALTLGEALALVFQPHNEPLPRQFVELLDRLEATDGRAAPAPGALSDGEFRRELEATLPALRSFARSLTRDHEAADDLVQETTLRAWSKRDMFQAGTNLRAWTFTMQRNLFMSDRRRARFKGEWDELRASKLLTTPAPQEHQIHLNDLMRALEKISPNQREALLLIVLGKMSYEEAGQAMGVEVGTVKSRVSRARQALGLLLDSELIEGRLSVAIAHHQAGTSAEARP